MLFIASCETKKDGADSGPVTAIELITPQAGTEVKSPLKIRGRARGSWFFEASFPARLTDQDGNSIAETPAEAEGEWMTENFVTFNAEINFIVDKKKSATLILEQANPAGFKEIKSVKIPLILLPAADQNTQKPCLKTGCSQQLCGEEEVINTCEWWPEYSCYKEAICERQSNGMCGFTINETLLQCFQQNAEARQSLNNLLTP